MNKEKQIRRAGGFIARALMCAWLAAFSFSALVGVVFGLWPARKASAMEPMEALRYE